MQGASSRKELKRIQLMKPKNGFLLIELMVGLVISLFSLFIITHYIIEIRDVQHKAQKKIKKISSDRNKREKNLYHSKENNDL
jgi:Tfp pilus assembly protein PilW